MYLVKTWEKSEKKIKILIFQNSPRCRKFKSQKVVENLCFLSRFSQVWSKRLQGSCLLCEKSRKLRKQKCDVNNKLLC